MGDPRSFVFVGTGDASGHGLVAQLKNAGYRPARPDVGDPAASFALVMAGSNAAETVRRVRTASAEYPDATILVVSADVTPSLAAAVAAAGGLAVLPPQAIVDAVRNLTKRRTRAIAHDSAAMTSSFVVEAAHDPASGRLDAKRMAELFGISVNTLAKAVGLTPSALSRRPTGKAAQVGMRELEFVWASLMRVFRRESAVRAWLRAPHGSLSGNPPMYLLEQGSAQHLADFVRRSIAGEPS